MRRRRQRELDWDLQWGDLAQFNTEVRRGVTHTPEYCATMAEKQARYNAKMLADAEAMGVEILDVKGETLT